MEAGKKNNRLLHLIIMLLLMFGFGFLKPFGQITHLGMQYIGIIVGTIYGWVFCDSLWPSFIAIVAFGLSEGNSVAGVIASGFGSQLMVMIMALLFLSNYLRESGCSDVIIRTFFKIKQVRKNPWILFYILFVTCFFVAVFTQAVPSFLIVVGIYKQLADMVGEPKPSKTSAFLLCGLVCSAGLSEVAAPFKIGAAFGIEGVFCALTGYKINWLVYMPVYLVIALSTIAIYCLSGRFILRLDISRFKVGDRIEEVIDFKQKTTKEQKTIMISFLVYLIGLFLQGIIPTTTAFGAAFSNIGTGGLSLLLLAFLCIVRFDEKPLMDLQSLAKDYYWAIYFMLCFFMPFATNFTNGSGLQETLSTLLIPIVDSTSGLFLLFILFFVCALATQFLNNGIVAVIVSSVIATVVTTIVDANPIAAGVFVFGLCNGVAFVLPSATPAATVAFSQKDIGAFKDMMKIGAIQAIPVFLWMSIAGYGLLSLVIV